MSKVGRNSLMIIVIAIVLFGIIWLVYDMVKEEPVDANINANLADENTGLDNIINELFDNSIINEQNDNVIESEEDNNNDTVASNIQDEVDDENETTAATGSTTESVTTREEMAVDLVKKEWGSTDGVYFSNESIDSQGRYIVSVRDKQTTAALAFYYVDVDKQLVTLQ